MVSFLRFDVFLWVTCGVVLAVAQLSAADPTRPGCLVFRQAQVQDHAWLQGDVTNNCSKAVTAFAITIAITYGGGRLDRESQEEDFLFGLGTLGRDAGAISSGQRRSISRMGVAGASDPVQSVISVVGTVSSVIFADSTAVGLDGEIDGLFSERRDALEELRFWRAEFLRSKSQFLRGVAVASLVSPEAVARRVNSLAAQSRGQGRVAGERGDQRRERALRIQGVSSGADFHARELRAVAVGIDQAVARGAVERGTAVDGMDTYLAGLVHNFELNSKRRLE